MNVQETIGLLESLHGIDVELGKVQRSLEAAQGAVADLLAEKAGYEARRHAILEESTALERTVRDAQIEARSTHGQIDVSREKYSRARNEKEVLAAERELEELRRIARDREKDAERGETRVKELAAEAERLAAQIADVDSRIQGASAGSDVGSLADEVATRTTGRDDLAKKLPPAIFRKYEAIRGKRGTALAHVSDGRCLACNIGLPPALFHKLRREPALENCPSCQRFLYFKA